MEPQALRKVGMLLALLATIAMVADSEVVLEGEHPVSQSTQAKLAVMDRQLWGSGPADTSDKLVQLPAEEPLPSQKRAVQGIEEDALQQAGFVEAGEEDDDTDAAERKPRRTQSLVEALEPAVAPTEELQTSNMEMQLEAQRKELMQMKMRAQEADVQAKHDKAVRQVLEEGVGARIREQQRFYSYMSRWWRLHRQWMKRHNVHLYRKLKEHRALSVSSLWKPFLLRWHYVQPRLLQGYRYNWNDDGTYTPKRYLMKSNRKSGNDIVAARIRSVNNLCFPGLLAPQRRHRLCRYKKHVSVRAVQFLLNHDKFTVPSLTIMRAYTSFVPGRNPAAGSDMQHWTKAKRQLTFVSVQGLHWQLREIVEYCDSPTSKTGVAVPVPYSASSTPTREYSLKFMEWQPIKMGRELLDTGATVENIDLKTKDEKIRISCVVPVDHPQNVDGEEVTLTSQKCSFYIRQWQFNLKCPAGKVGAIALKTQVTARDDTGSGDGKPTMTPTFKNQLAFNKNKVSLQFEQQAVLHLHDSEKGTDYRNSVPVTMTQSATTEWTADPRFKSSKNVFFSFIVSDVKRLGEGILNWDPTLNGNFNQNPVRTMNVVKTAKAVFEAATPPPTPPLPSSVKPVPTGSATKEVNAYEFIQTQSLPDTVTSSSCSWWNVMSVGC